MAKIVGNRIVPDEIITEQDTWRTDMNPQNAWGNYGINTLGNAPFAGLEQFPLAHAGAAGPDYLDMGVDLSGVNLDDTGIYTHQKGEPFLAENRRNIFANLFNPEVNWRGYQRRPDDFNFPSVMGGIMNAVTGRRGADQSFGGYPGGWGSRAGLFPQEVSNLQAVADAGYLGNQGQDVFGTNIVSQLGDYNEAMAKNLGVFQDTVGKKEGIENLDELEKYYLDRFGANSYIYNKLRHVRGMTGQPTEIIQDKITTDVIPTETTGGAITPGASERARQGGYNPSARSFRSAPGGLSQAQSRAARGDPTGTGGGWKWAQGGRVGYRDGEFVDEDVNIAGPGFDVNENIEMASAPDPMDALNDMSMNIFGKPLHDLTPEEYDILIDMANDQAAIGQGEGIASLV